MCWKNIQLSSETRLPCPSNPSRRQEAACVLILLAAGVLPRMLQALNFPTIPISDFKTIVESASRIATGVASKGSWEWTILGPALPLLLSPLFIMVRASPEFCCPSSYHPGDRAVAASSLLYLARRPLASRTDASRDAASTLARPTPVLRCCRLGQLDNHTHSCFGIPCRACGCPAKACTPCGRGRPLHHRLGVPSGDGTSLNPACIGGTT